MEQPEPQPQPQPIPVKGAGGASALLIVGIVVVVLVFIVGILAAIAIPSFVKYGCRSKQAEAKTEIRGIHVAAQAFFEEHNRYPLSLEEIGWEPRGPTPRYDYQIVEGGADKLLVEAVGNDALPGDRWTIDHKREVEHPEDACR